MNLRINIRLVVIALLAVAILVALVMATGGGFSSSSSPSPPPPPPTAPPSQAISGAVTVQASHLSRHTWRFVYRVHNKGTTPIAGFQLNGPHANLFHIETRRAWTYFGSGVCGGHYPGVLIYWSTSGADLIEPGHSGSFAFEVNTRGSTGVGYSLSWHSATPAFGKVQGPAGSKLRASGSCR